MIVLYMPLLRFMKLKLMMKILSERFKMEFIFELRLNYLRNIEWRFCIRYHRVLPYASDCFPTLKVSFFS